MKSTEHIIILSFLIILYACNMTVEPVVSFRDCSFNFNDIGKENWMSLFSDYPVGQEIFYELEFQYTNLPEPLDTNIKSLMISGNNHSDDLFSAIYRKFNGLKPNTNYKVTFDIELASNAPTNAAGVGGSPDLSIGAGGINYAPENNIDELNFYRPNFESLLQAGTSNDVFQVLGTIGVSDIIPTPFTLINRSNLDDPLIIESNSKGEIWVMIATDSGFEATTTLYYKLIKIRLEEE